MNPYPAAAHGAAPKSETLVRRHFHQLVEMAKSNPLPRKIMYAPPWPIPHPTTEIQSQITELDAAIALLSAGTVKTHLEVVRDCLALELKTRQTTQAQYSR